MKGKFMTDKKYPIKVWVYDDKLWSLVGPEDKNYIFGLTTEEFEKHSPEYARVIFDRYKEGYPDDCPDPKEDPWVKENM